MRTEDSDRKIDPEIQAVADSLDIEVLTPWGKPDRVRSVRFLFPSPVWADLCNMEGNLLPSCCTSVSAIREAFAGALHSDGVMDSEDLQKVYVNRVSPDWTADHPVSKAVAVYEALEDRLYFPSGPSSDDVQDPEDAAARVAFGDLWKWALLQTDARINSDFGVSCRDRATNNFRLLEFAPTIGLLSRKLADMALPPAEGWAIVRVGARPKTVIYQLSSGDLAIFPDRHQATETLGRWVKTGQLKAGEGALLPVRVSFEAGVEELASEPNDPVPVPVASAADARTCWDALNDLRRKIENDAIDVVLRDAITRIQELAKGNPS
jgi:hypothetical protein